MELIIIIALGILLAFVVVKVFAIMLKTLGIVANYTPPRWTAFVVLILLLLGWLFLEHPAKAASDDVISNLRFGAAITSVFNNQCRPVNGAAFALAVQVLSGMSDDERFRLLRRARTILDQSNKTIFCGMFEENIQIMEGSQ